MPQDKNSSRELIETFSKLTGEDPKTTKQRFHELRIADVMPDYRLKDTWLTSRDVGVFLIATLGADKLNKAADAARKRCALVRGKVVCKSPITLWSETGELLSDLETLLESPDPRTAPWLATSIEVSSSHEYARLTVVDMRRHAVVSIHYGQREHALDSPTRPVRTTRMLEGPVLLEMARLAA